MATGTKKKREKVQGTEFLEIRPKKSQVQKEQEASSENGEKITDEDQVVPVKEEKPEPPPPPPDAKKFCSKGNHWVEITEFAKRAASPDGLQTVCKTCMKVYQQQYTAARQAQRAANPRPRTNGVSIPGIPNAHTPVQLILVDNTGMTDEEFEEKSASQGHKCAICKKRKHRALDFDPLTGKRRGLLCIQCNIAVAMVSYNRKIAIRLAKYLRVWEEDEAIEHGG